MRGWLWIVPLALAAAEPSALAQNKPLVIDMHMHASNVQVGPGGSYRGQRILSRTAVKTMTGLYTEFPPGDGSRGRVWSGESLPSPWARADYPCSPKAPTDTEATGEHLAGSTPRPDSWAFF